MNIKQVRYFIAVAEEQHIGRAATRLHLSQPPLTRQIQALEQELGVSLFRRTPHGVELTDAGRSFWRDAINIQHLVEQTTERTRRAGKGQSGRLDVGIFGSAILTIVPKILCNFTKTHPDVEVVLNNAPFSQQIEALLQRRVQIAFDRHLSSNTELTAELVHREHLVVAVNRYHPLAKKQTISLSDLTNQRLIGGQKGVVGRKMVDLFHSSGAQANIIYESPDMITAVSLVGGGMGATLAPESISNITLPNVVFRPLEAKEKLNFDLFCVYRRDDDSPLLREMLDVVKEYRENQDHDMSSPQNHCSAGRSGEPNN